MSAQQVGARVGNDALLGRVIAERYEVLELIGAGGMGRVYRGVQRSLDRPIAIKVIDPSLFGAGMGDAIAARFMVEARTASRLNHPNVVSVFDFGRISASENQLFLAMELLAGTSLEAELATGRALSHTRIASIVRQVLAALAEAHQQGITHRDVKPGNVVVERRRDDVDHVKVIDFGIARVGAERTLTAKDQLIGTPYYMAPEQARAGGAVPSMDLYSVGIMLFEMLTGRVPFDGTTAEQIVRAHAHAPRPDPRAVAPERSIPPALAQVCVRAIAVDPRDRYPDAASLAAAILGAATATGWTVRDRSWFPHVRESSPATDEIARADTVPPPLDRVGPPSRARAASTPLLDAPLLVGRDEHLVWAREKLASRADVPALVFWGPSGMGKTRMLQEVSTVAEALGAWVVATPSEPAPLHELSFGALRAVIAGLTLLDRSGLERAALDEKEDPLAAEGLDVALQPWRSRRSGDPTRALVAALHWAAKRAAKRSGGARCVVLIDDVDRIDSVSRDVLGAVLLGEPLPRTTLLLSSSSPPVAAHDRVFGMELRGLSREDAGRLVDRVQNSRRSRPSNVDKRIEPLYLEQYLRLRAEADDERVPSGLPEIVHARLAHLPPSQRRALQAVAVVGKCTGETLNATLMRPSGLGDAVAALGEAQLVNVRSGTIRLPHAIFARIALQTAPAGTIEDLHARAADALEDAPEEIELRAYHAIRGRVDFEAFMLVEETARLRGRCGDHDGAVAALSDGFAAARRDMARDEASAAASAWTIFGKKLGQALVDMGRMTQAEGVLAEVLQSVSPGDPARIDLLAQLALVSRYRGDEEQANALLGEARAAAKGAGRAAPRLPLVATTPPATPKPVFARAPRAL